MNQSARIVNAEHPTPQHRHAHTQHLAGTQVSVRDLRFPKQRFQRLHSLIINAF
jgi:hypothetical protein